MKISRTQGFRSQVSIAPDRSAQPWEVGREIVRHWGRLPGFGPFLAVCFLAMLTFHLHAAPTRIPWTSNRVAGSPNPPAPYTVERLFPRLGFTNPVDVAVLPGSDRILVQEQGGRLLSFPARSEVDHADLVFDFRAHHQPFDSTYSFAFHPLFARNRYVFVCYVEPGGRENGSHVSRFTLLDSNPPTLDPKSEKVIIRWLSGGHNGCTVAFGNDGFLYISTGDAADPDPPDGKFRTGQDTSDLLAGILRIDVDHDGGTNSYAIPPSNPFVKTPGARPEVYAYGLRNPWRMSFDRPTGDLWVGDVGWEQWEMIHRVKSGGNYGWSIVEGPNTHVRTDVKPGPGPIQPPLVALPHSDAASITGGRVYHGRKLPKLRGAYLYGDWETGKFWALRHDGDRLVSNDELCDTTLKPVSFAEDRSGELLILDYSGGLYRFVPNSAPPANLAFPRRLSETGLYRDLAILVPSAGVVPYQPNAGMWSDLATVERVLGVPGEGAIITADGRETIAGRMWSFPSNTVLARTLTLEMEQGRPATRRRIETQMMHFDGQGWNAYTFHWNAAQTDADLVRGEGTNEVFKVTDPAAPGGQREIPWRFASRTECLRCHNAWAGDTLSFNWLELNTRGTPSELDRLAQLGVLRVKDPPKPLSRLSDPYDASLALGDRARSWLHLNCSTCHRFGAGGDVPSWFNIDQPIAEARVLDAKPSRGDLGIPGACVIASGDPYRSTLFYRINTEGSGRMPHIGSRLVDEKGVRVLRDWIRSLPAMPGGEGDTAAVRKLARENDALISRCRGETHREDVAQLLASMSGSLALLDACAPEGGDPAGRGTGAVPPARLREEVAAAAAAHTNALVRDLFQRLLPPAQRRRTLGTDFNPQVIFALKGDPVRGRELFVGMAQCSRCHVAGREGRAYGPELTDTSKKYRTGAQLLEQIQYPSRIIAPEFKTILLTLRDETELNGFVVKRTATELVLRDETLAEHTVKVSDVKDSRQATLSAMPEGLLAPLTAQEVADLLEFLLTPKPLPSPPR